MSAAVCAMAAGKTDAEYLEEARWICKRVPNVWFTTEYRVDAATRRPVPFFKIFRKSMGFEAERSTPAALVSYLRKQLPPEVKA